MATTFSITMPRGDIRHVGFSIKDISDQLSDIDFEEIYFTVKQAFSKSEYIFQKRLSTGDIQKVDAGIYQFAIRPEDTDNLKVSKYVCDIEIVDLSNDIKQTFTGSFTLTDEATHAANEV